MIRIAAGCVLTLAVGGVVLAATPSELFQKVKAQYAGASYTRALSTIDELEMESQKPEHETIQAQLRPALAFYKGACLAELGKPAEAQAEFATYLAVQPAAVIDRSIFPKKTFAAFEQARKKAGLRSAPAQSDSLSYAFAAFRAPEPAAGAEGEAWADGPVKFLMTANEKREWAGSKSASERSEFITRFWEARNPKPEYADNPFRRTFEKRVAFADSRFGQDETRGSLSDRGMVFVLLGPPTYVGRKPFSTEDAARPTVGGEALLSSRLSAGVALPRGQAPDSEGSWREVWHYRREFLPRGTPYQLVDIEFLTKKGYGKNVLQREPQTLTTLKIASTK